jgi:7SK snRNA methylphosphate capping enzyme
MSAVLTHGWRTKPDSTPSRRPPSKWPQVNFISEDWVLSANPATSGPYDVILALSVIKWIHLEHLDKGLVSFFRKCSSSLAPGGYFIIELQTWESYEKAVRPGKAPHFKDTLKTLKYRPETSFDDLLKKYGLNLCATCTALPRQMSVYRKI